MGESTAGQGEGDSRSDAVLVGQVHLGDREAYTGLVRRYERLVFRIAGGFLRDSAEVEDVAQEAFLRAYEALPRFRPDAPFGPWIAAIATRLCYDRLRKRQRDRQVAWESLSAADQAIVQALATGRTAEDVASVRDLADRVLSGMAPKDRMALVLVDAFGYSAGEAARALGCSALAIRLRLHRARRALRRASERLLAGC
jgi:RNA polymerase sigma-70 factor (ECF subfamily)